MLIYRNLISNEIIKYYSNVKIKIGKKKFLLKSIISTKDYIQILVNIINI